MIGKIPWIQCLREALPWLSVVICEVSGFSSYVFYLFLHGIVGKMSDFSCYFFYIFLRRIVGDEKGIQTNGFRCRPKAIEVLARKLVKGDPMENTCDQQISGFPQSLGRH